MELRKLGILAIFILFAILITLFLIQTYQGSLGNTSRTGLLSTPWLGWAAIASLSVVSLLFYTLIASEPAEFSRIPVYEFIALTIFVVFFILTISLFPEDPFGRDFPISTTPFATTTNTTQWVINIGGIPDDPEHSLGLQIPIYIIIAGILGAYIRYLYLGIKEFKNRFERSLLSFQDKDHSFTSALDRYSRFVGRKVNRLDLDKELVFQEEVIFLPPEAREPYSKQKEPFWQAIVDTRKELQQELFKARFQITNHILETVGFFFLAPLLAVLAWLLLSIGGTGDLLTFALFSFAIGLTTKTIVNRIISFVGEKIQDDGSTISATPDQGLAGQTTKISGKGFDANSNINLKYVGSGIDVPIGPVISSTNGGFNVTIRIPSQSSAGIYIISATDESGNASSTTFTVL